MKYISLCGLALVVIVLVGSSCNQIADNSTEPQVTDSTTTREIGTAGRNNANAVLQNFSVEPIVKDYLALKNALAADDDKGAARAARQLSGSLKGVDMNVIPADKHKDYMDIAGNAKENAEHIGANAGKIDHQREHLASLSKDIADLIELFGTKQKLYQDYCPMYDDGKGAVWISETKEIKNPYYGGKMISCGSVKKEY